MESPGHGASGGNRSRLHQPVQSEDRKHRGGDALHGGIDARRSHAHVGQDSSGSQDGSGRL